MFIRRGTSEANALGHAMVRLGRRKNDYKVESGDGWEIPDVDPVIPLLREMLPECEARKREKAEVRRLREVESNARRNAQEQEKVAWAPSFAAAIQGMFPGCPEKVVQEISHRKGYKEKSSENIRDAVAAYIRHRMTDYDGILRQGEPTCEEFLRWESLPPREREWSKPTFKFVRQAREAIKPKVEAILKEWKRRKQ